MEFNSDQWDELINHSKEREIDFICSVFSKESITMLENKNINAWKLGSGEVFNRELNNKLLKTNLPIIASSGMSNWDDIDKIVALNNNHHHGFYLMHCCSISNSSRSVRFNIIDEMRSRHKARSEFLIIGKQFFLFW